MRSWPEKKSRLRVTDATVAFGVASSEIMTGVTTVPGGNATPSSPFHPVRWKSLMMTASRFGNSDSSKIVWANFRAGPYRVPSALRLAVSRAESRRSRSEVARKSASALLDMKTRLARSEASRPSKTTRGLTLGPLPAVAITHRVGSVQYHDNFAGSEGGADPYYIALEEWATECGHEKRQCQSPDRQQRPVVDFLAPARPKGDLPEEHQRREVHHLAALFLRQVDDDGHHQTHEAQQEKRGEKTHQRTLAIFSRLERYWKRA